jgi:hypothetical protein
VAQRLKVFVTSDGLTDFVVAVTSRAKALAAWGVKQDLFKEGRAGEARDPAVLKAALAKPGEVLRRPRDAGAFEAMAAAKPAKRATGPSPAQRRKVEQLTHDLDKLKAAFAKADVAFNEEIAGLGLRRTDAVRTFEVQKRQLERALKAAGKGDA